MYDSQLLANVFCNVIFLKLSFCSRGCHQCVLASECARRLPICQSVLAICSVIFLRQKHSVVVYVGVLLCACVRLLVHCSVPVCQFASVLVFVSALQRASLPVCQCVPVHCSVPVCQCVPVCVCHLLQQPTSADLLLLPAPLTPCWYLLPLLFVFIFPSSKLLPLHDQCNLGQFSTTHAMRCNNYTATIALHNLPHKQRQCRSAPCPQTCCCYVQSLQILFWFQPLLNITSSDDHQSLHCSAQNTSISLLKQEQVVFVKYIMQS